MKFAGWLNLSPAWSHVLDQAKHLDETGWDGIYVADHFMPGGPENLAPIQECWTTLAALAASTSNVRLGSLVTGNTYRHPPVLAKMAAQVDIISGGRLVFGLGAAWQQNEHEAYGIEYGTAGWRLQRLEESVQIIRSLFREERTTFQGKHYQVKDAPLSPKPVQDGGPKILIGGGGEQKTLRIVAKYADEWNIWGKPELLAQKGAVLDQRCEEIGRDPKSVYRSAQAIVTVSDDPAVVERARNAPGFASIAGSVDEIVDTLGRYAEAGVDEFIIPNFNFGRGTNDAYDRLMQDVIPQAR